MKLKYQIILFTVIILGCSFGISNEVVYKAESKSDVTLTTQSIVQDHKKCKIYQYEGVDSLNKKLVSVEEFNDNGDLVFYYYKNYRESASTGYSDTKHFLFC